METNKDEIISVYSNGKEKQSYQENIDIEKNKSKWHWKIVDDHSPPQIYNMTLYMSVFVFGILGSARGYDEGNIAGTVTQTNFKQTFGLSDPDKSVNQLANLKSNITSMVQLGSIGGSILAMYTVDKLGRIRALQGAVILMLVGALIQITSYNVGQLYAGRFIEGLGIGQTTTIGPTYMSEVAPKSIRGLCGGVFAGAVYFGIMIAYFANYGTAVHIPDIRLQWVLPTSLKLVLSGIIVILSFFFCVESPRWLIKTGKLDLAAQNLSKLRHLPIDHPYIVGEISDINDQVIAEKEATSGSSVFELFRTIFTVKANIYRFVIVSSLAQILGQWSGANAITIYSPELFGFAGITGIDILKMTAVLGVVKFVSAYLCAFFIIDFLGRRKALYIGVSIQLITLLYFAIFLTIVPQAADGGVLTSSQTRASKGAMAALFLSGTGWTMGFNSVQYLLGSEVFPLKIRSFAQSLVMVLHFTNQYGNSKAVPKMLLALTPYGAFYFFVGVNAISLFWAWFFVPEVAGRSLESMEAIFNLPWYLIGRNGPELCPDYSELNRISYHKENGGTSYENHIDYDMENNKPTQEFIERQDNGIKQKITKDY